MYKRLPENIEKLFKLELTDKIVNDSFAQGYVFYKTEFNDVYLTNYDFIMAQKMDLVKDNIWILFYKNKEELNYIYLSGYVFNSENYSIFIKEINRVKYN